MKKIDLSVKIKDLTFKNPVITASGTFGYGVEFFDFFDVNELGGITLKAVTVEPRFGNATPRIAETSSGMLNAIGLANKGLQYFVDTIIPSLDKIKTNIIANIAGKTNEDYEFIADKLNQEKKISAIEVNISCPNVKEGGIAFGQDVKTCVSVLSRVRKKYSGVMIVKLTPNVTDVKEFAKLAESEGADAISLINTLKGISVDIYKMKPNLANVTGGLSGPAIKPIALRMVAECAACVKIPIIGMGGIMNHEDALEFIMVGASLIAVGTANMVDPMAAVKIKDGIKMFLEENGFSSIAQIRGKIKI